MIIVSVPIAYVSVLTQLLMNNILGNLRVCTRTNNYNYTMNTKEKYAQIIITAGVPFALLIPTIPSDYDG